MNETDIPFALVHSRSEKVEMFYQLVFFIFGIPINIHALIVCSKTVREGGVESRLVKLSRQLLIAHIMVLFMYGIWRTYWFYEIVWVQGDFLCKIYSFLTAVPFHLWSNMVAAIAIDMLYCIKSPLSSYQNESNRVTWLISMAWALAITCSLPMLYIKGTVRISDDLYQCYPRKGDINETVLQTFNMFHLLTSFYIPFIIIVGCYVVIFLLLKKQEAERKLLQDGARGQKGSKTKKRFLRVTIAIIFTFGITWLPYQGFALLREICKSQVCQEIVTDFNWSEAIIVASTCINPFIYRFGVKSKRTSSRYCSTMDTYGKEVTAQSVDRRRTVNPKRIQAKVENGLITPQVSVQEEQELIADTKSKS